MMKNNFGRANWPLMFVIFLTGMAAFVMAVAPSWDGASLVNYTLVEDTNYYHNLSLNITGFDSDIDFSIDTAPDNKINWTNSSGSSVLVSPSEVSSWIQIYDSSTGNLTINATYDNQTGFFVIPIQALNTTDSEGTITNFEFIINATNDAPNFTSDGIFSNYAFSSNEMLQNFTLSATDEDEHYPLYFNVSFISNNCTHGVGTGYSDNSDCNLSAFGLNVTSIGNTLVNVTFIPNSSYVGTYWANVSVQDAATNYNCPHDWCDSTYNTTNATTYYSELVEFTVSPSIAINVTNCTGSTLLEDTAFNCTAVVTTPGEADLLNISTNASFRTVSTPGNYNSSWFVPTNSSPIGSNFNHNISFVVTPTKENVGNLSINLSVVDVTSEVNESVLIYLYVNYTESGVSLSTINDITRYENGSFEVVATDADLLILDSSVKNEVLTFGSNTSWVTFSDETPLPVSGNNYTTATANIDYDYALNNLGTGNYSVLINVSDVAVPNNTDSKTFTIQIMNGSTPEWNSSLDDPVSLSLVEDTAFTYNVSVNVTDADGDPINFTYENISGEFCSLNSTTFNQTSGIISFTPTDCDVGYHNVTITATDGNLNSSKQFNFTVENLADSPTINSFSANNGSLQTLTAGFNLAIAEAGQTNFSLIVDDNDFLIPESQKTNFYNESLTLNLTLTNSTGSLVDLFNLTYQGISGVDDSWAEYNASFTPTGLQIGNYTAFLNITDNNGNNTNRTFYLNITEVLDAPAITPIVNQSITIYDHFNLSVSATDDEDDRNGLNLTYGISNLTVGAPNLTINNETGNVTFDLDSNESYAGKWEYNVTATDSDGLINSTTFWLFVYSGSSLISPTSGGVFNLTETVASVLNFSINHTVLDNLTYEFWVDSIECTFQNNSNCTYGNLTLREVTSSFGNGSSYGWSFDPNYTDETYGNVKNLTVSVYPNTTQLNSTQLSSVATNFSFGLNITHSNAPVEIYNSFGSYSSTYGSSTPVEINLTQNIRDYDYLDSYYLENVTFSINSTATTTGITAESDLAGNALNWSGLISDWQLELYANSALTESVIIRVNDSSTDDTSNPFSVTFTEPSVVPNPEPSSGGGGGGGGSSIRHYSLKLVVPQDIIISDQNYIDVPFSVQNNGQVDLRGINLSSLITYNNQFSSDVSISLIDTYIKELKYGQSENFSMRIIANTQRSGKYKATIYANVTSPKFSDWGDFFIDLQKTNESEAEQILLFTEKLLADNPECLELTELLNSANDFFDEGDIDSSLALAQQAVDACEKAIQLNEQIKYPVVGFVRDNFYYILLSTLVIFLAGFIMYIYKRIRFNKAGMNDYV